MMWLGKVMFMSHFSNNILKRKKKRPNRGVNETIYEGSTQREQDLVDERIDPEILRALGLEDVVDLDYDEYKTLLKERLVQ